MKSSGKGLKAIIRDTSVDGTGFEIGETLPDNKRIELEEKLTRVTAEKDELHKTLDSEIPQGAAKQFLVETLINEAKERDKEYNLLDSFHLYRRAIRFDPENIEALKAVAIIYYSAGILEKAAETLRAVIEIDPNQKRVKENLLAIESKLRKANSK